MKSGKSICTRREEGARLGAPGGVGARHGRVRAAWARAPRGEADLERVESGVDSHHLHGMLRRCARADAHAIRRAVEDVIAAELGRIQAALIIGRVVPRRKAREALQLAKAAAAAAVVAHIDERCAIAARHAVVSRPRRGVACSERLLEDEGHCGVQLLHGHLDGNVGAHVQADPDRRVLQHVAGQHGAHAEVRGANGQVGVGVELREDGERGAVRRNDRAGLVAREVVVRQGEREGPLRTTGVGRRELRRAGGRAGRQRSARTFGAPMCVDVGVN